MMRHLIVVFGLSACALAGDPSESVNQAATSAASVKLSSSNAAITQTSNSAWSLSKTGAVNTTSKTVTWTISATKTATKAGQLVVSGFMAVSNNGGTNATIGNIAVDLQTKSGSSWKSVSADCTDATHDDAATSCNIDPKASSENLSVLAENAASGELQFMDATSNSVFSLVPEKTIAPGATVDLLFAASFDNTVLNLSTGKAVRAEVIVSFGNSTSNNPSAQNVDISGNGVIDADEAWVRSVPTRLGLTVPAQHADNSSITINDSAANITTTGTVTFSNAQFNLGSTSGTVTVSYDGGSSGGKITNCATGTGVGTTVTVGGFTFSIDGGAGLQACDTEDIGANTCTEGAPGCGWKNGDLTSYSQGSWAVSPASSTLTNNFFSVYTSGTVEVGGNFVMDFTSAANVLKYIPSVGTAAALDANLDNATSSSSGVFGGDVLALRFDIDFSQAGVLTSGVSTKFGSLLICGLTDASVSGLNGQSISQFSAVVNTLLGGGSFGGYSISDLDPLTQQITGAFESGSPSSWAQAHLFVGACPP